MTAPRASVNVARATMLILRGSPALSSFRLQKLLADLQAAGLPARAVAAEFCHLVELAPGEYEILRGPTAEA